LKSVFAIFFFEKKTNNLICSGDSLATIARELRSAGRVGVIKVSKIENQFSLTMFYSPNNKTNKKRFLMVINN
jgi:hypothetical protein